jgi:hypothetical protein
VQQLRDTELRSVPGDQRVEIIAANPSRGMHQCPGRRWQVYAVVEAGRGVRSNRVPPASGDDTHACVTGGCRSGCDMATRGSSSVSSRLVRPPTARIITGRPQQGAIPLRGEVAVACCRRPGSRPEVVCPRLPGSQMAAFRGSPRRGCRSARW